MAYHNSDNTDMLPDPTDSIPGQIVWEVVSQELGINISALKAMVPPLVWESLDWQTERPLVWNDRSCGQTFQDLRKKRFIKEFPGDERRKLVAIAFQLIGTKQKPCGHCRDKRGEWVDCIRPHQLQNYSGTIPCANCIVRGLSETCDLDSRDSVTVYEQDEQLEAVTIAGEFAMGLGGRPHLLIVRLNRHRGLA
jgi:hypothetical protein